MGERLHKYAREREGERSEAELKHLLFLFSQRSIEAGPKTSPLTLSVPQAVKHGSLINV